VTIPGNTPLGTYYLLACADDTLLVTESDETNNCIASTSTIQVTAPDLKETAVSNPPASVKQGGSFNVTDTTANVGTGPAGASTTRYYLSLDKTKGATDVLLTGSRAVLALAAGASSTGTVGVSVPVPTPLGTYYLLACADDLKVVKESKEGNNCRASASKVQVTGP
jgi:subtilase family serine protease